MNLALSAQRTSVLSKIARKERQMDPQVPLARQIAVEVAFWVLFVGGVLGLISLVVGVAVTGAAPALNPSFETQINVLRDGQGLPERPPTVGPILAMMVIFPLSYLLARVLSYRFVRFVPRPADLSERAALQIPSSRR